MSGLKDRVEGIVTKLNSSIEQLLRSQRVRMIRGTARLDGPHRVLVRQIAGLIARRADRGYALAFEDGRLRQAVALGQKVHGFPEFGVAHPVILSG